MVISVSLNHQQCYNFRKIQQENTKWTGAVVYMRRFTVSFPPWGPCKDVYYTSLRARGPCPLLTRPTLKTIRGTCRHRTAGHWPLDVRGSGCRCDTPGSSWKYSVQPKATQSNAILFSCSMAVPFTEQSVYFRPYIKLKWNDNPVQIANEAYQFQRKLWKNRDLTV